MTWLQKLTLFVCLSLGVSLTPAKAVVLPISGLDMSRAESHGGRYVRASLLVDHKRQQCTVAFEGLHQGTNCWERCLSCFRSRVFAQAFSFKSTRMDFTRRVVQTRDRDADSVVVQSWWITRKSHSNALRYINQPKTPMSNVRFAIRVLEEAGIQGLSCYPKESFESLLESALDASYRDPEKEGKDR